MDETTKSHQKLFATRKIVYLVNFSMVSSASHAQNFKKTKITIYQKFILPTLGSLVPYANIIQYSEDIVEDLSHLKIADFLKEMERVASECYRVLKKDKFCAILMGDTRINGLVQPMSFEVMKIFESVGFKTKEIIIKEQHNCRATGYWKTNSIKYNFLLLAHEYLFVFRK